MKIIQMNYSISIKSKEDLETMVNLYAIQFRNYPANAVNTAVMNIIANDSSPFAPTIGKIKENIKIPQLLENANSIMKKYDKHYDDQYDYREDEMLNRILHNPFHVPEQEMKDDFKKCICKSYDDYMQSIHNFLEKAIPQPMRGEYFK